MEWWEGVWLSGGNWFWWWHDFLNWRFSAQRDSAGWISPCSRNSAPRWTEADSQKPILGKSERRIQIYHRQKKFVLTCDVNCPRWGRSWHHSGGRQHHCFWRWNVNTLYNCMSRSASKKSIRNWVHDSHKGRAAIRHYANQTARPLWLLCHRVGAFSVIVQLHRLIDLRH